MTYIIWYFTAGFGTLLVANVFGVVERNVEQNINVPSTVQTRRELIDPFFFVDFRRIDWKT
jgi:hypothetical protein